MLLIILAVCSMTKAEGRIKELWEKCADNIKLPTVYRNLSLVYYNKLKDGVLALKAMEKAFCIDKSDARIFFELDQLYKTLNFSLEKRLANMNENSDLLEKRDDFIYGIYHIA